MKKNILILALLLVSMTSFCEEEVYTGSEGATIEQRKKNNEKKGLFGLISGFFNKDNSDEEVYTGSESSSIEQIKENSTSAKYLAIAFSVHNENGNYISLMSECDKNGNVIGEQKYEEYPTTYDEKSMKEVVNLVTDMMLNDTFPSSIKVKVHKKEIGKKNATIVLKLTDA